MVGANQREMGCCGMVRGLRGGGRRREEGGREERNRGERRKNKNENTLKRIHIMWNKNSPFIPSLISFIKRNFSLRFTPHSFISNGECETITNSITTHRQHFL